MKIFPRAIFLLTAIAWCLGGPVRGAELRLFAAASLTDALQEASQVYLKQKGVKVVLNFGASSILARQIEAGAPADLFFSADEEKMDLLGRRGLIVNESRRDLLSNRLVIVTEKSNPLGIVGPQDLSKCSRIALAEPATVPAGIYARQYLEGKKLWNGLKPKIVPAENVRAALLAVADGNADAAIVYLTDLSLSRKVKKVFEIPSGEGPRIRYPIATVAACADRSAAAAFIDFLASAEGRTIFEKHGFISVK